MVGSERDTSIIGPDDPILVTGATGFIGSRLVENLLGRGFRNLRCFARPSSHVATLDALAGRHRGARIQLVEGNLLSREDCAVATRDVAVIFRPGYVYGPGHEEISARVGIGTFGVFLHLGGWNTLPFTYVDNCAEAIALAGLKKGVEGKVFNVVDDELPSSRRFLRLYKQNVRRFASIGVP